MAPRHHRKHIRSQPVVRREAMAQVEVQLSQRLAKEGSSIG